LRWREQSAGRPAASRGTGLRDAPLPCVLRLHLGPAAARGGGPPDRGESGPGTSPGGAAARVAGIGVLQPRVIAYPHPGAVRRADRRRRRIGSRGCRWRRLVRLAPVAALGPSGKGSVRKRIEPSALNERPPTANGYGPV